MAGEYGYGIDVNLNFMEMPSATEECNFIHPDVVHKFSFKRYDPQAVEFGSTQFPLNIYGDKDQHKPFDPTGPSNDEILDVLKR